MEPYEAFHDRGEKMLLNGTVVQTVASAANVVSLESLEPFSPYVVAIQACTGMAQIILLPRSIHTHMHTRTNIMSRPGLAQTLHARPPTVCRLRRARMRLTPSQRHDGGPTLLATPLVHRI